jgi:NADPH:quinone reductase-like Zn-dependent oxidoreductase
MSNVAIVQDGFNREDPLSTLKLVTKPIPTPAAGQVVVRVKLRNIHVFDFITLRGPGVANGTPGSEGYGIVHEVGEGVTKVQKGQRVVPIITEAITKGNGIWQEYVCLEAEYVWPIPDAITDEQAAQFVINPWTAYSMVKDLSAVPKTEYLVQTAAGSTLGKQVIALANHMNIKLINVVRRAEQKAELEALGAEEVICSAEEDVPSRVREITGGRGAWGVLDAIGGAMTQTLATCTRDGGRIFVYGMLGGPAATVNTTDLWRGVQPQGWTLFTVLLNPEKREACAAEVTALMSKGVIQVAKAEKYDLADFKKALARAEVVSSSVKIMLESA